MGKEIRINEPEGGGCYSYTTKTVEGGMCVSRSQKLVTVEIPEVLHLMVFHSEENNGLFEVLTMLVKAEDWAGLKAEALLQISGEDWLEMLADARAEGINEGWSRHCAFLSMDMQHAADQLHYWKVVPGNADTRLETFGSGVLDILEADEDWSSETLDKVSGLAENLDLSTGSDEFLFKRKV